MRIRLVIAFIVVALASALAFGVDLSVRIQPRGRDKLAALVTSFNGMAFALEDKVGELERMEARARQFAGDVSHELRTPLTAMTAVTDILHEHPGLTGDAAAAARLVRDGLPFTAIPHLFERFFKADTARTRSEGSGLGLAIARENARLHGGHIDAGNHCDGGAIFTVSLPVPAGRP